MRKGQSLLRPHQTRLGPTGAPAAQPAPSSGPLDADGQVHRDRIRHGARAGADVDALREQTEKLARALQVRGLMNVQFAVQGDQIYVLEVNPRASRTVPFVAKATGVPVAKIAARVMAGETLAQLPPAPHNAGQMAVKEAVFPFDRFPGVDVLLGPEMRSTGEVMGLDEDFGHAFLKAQLAANVKLPTEGGTVFLSVRDHDKARLQELGQIFQLLDPLRDALAQALSGCVCTGGASVEAARNSGRWSGWI